MITNTMKILKCRYMYGTKGMHEVDTHKVDKHAEYLNALKKSPILPSMDEKETLL